MQWSFSNKICAGPQFLSFRTSQEDRPRKTQQESLASSGFMTISNADVFNTNQQPNSGIIQVHIFALALQVRTSEHYFHSFSNVNCVSWTEV